MNVLPQYLTLKLSCPTRVTLRVIAVHYHHTFSYSCSPMKRKSSHSSFDPLHTSSSPPKRLRSSSTSTSPTMTTAKITLTDPELRLRSLLLDVASFIDTTSPQPSPITLRFAGGWVRDKLLNIASHDIDATINVMTGFTFTTFMKTYLEEPSNKQKHILHPKDIGNLYKIQANPEKSKHLETATMKIFGFDVDFVNLRKETYSEDSRNPQMEFGSPKEDAERRDATINSLFYNLHTDEVEDFTGGLKDLEDGLIRTPMDPRTTFMDDPLRVLRLVRFASRLGFRIDGESERWMGDGDIREALKMKISRERVGVEVEKMLTGKNPLLALQFFHRLSLYPTIFTDPTNPTLPPPNTTSWPSVYNLLSTLLSNPTPSSISSTLIGTFPSSLYISWILCSLVPWSSIPLPTPTTHKTKPIGALVAREGLKADNKIANVVSGSFKNYLQITELKDAILAKEEWVNKRDVVGMKIRRWEANGGHWRLQTLFSLLVERFNTPSPTTSSSATSSTPSPSDQKIITSWQTFLDHLQEMNILDAPNIKPVIDGKILCRELGGVRPGEWMKGALDVCMEWQLRNPGETEVKGAVEEVRGRGGMLGIPGF